MRWSRMLIPALCLALLIGVLGTTSLEATQSQHEPVTLTLQRIGKSSFASVPMATDVSGVPDEIDAAVNSGDADGNNGNEFGIGINRSLPGTATGKSKRVDSKPKSNPVLDTHFQGLNFHDQRFANGGNQFSVEPPDQGLCAGNAPVGRPTYPSNVEVSDLQLARSPEVNGRPSNCPNPKRRRGEPLSCSVPQKQEKAFSFVADFQRFNSKESMPRVGINPGAARSLLLREHGKRHPHKFARNAP